MEGEIVSPSLFFCNNFFSHYLCEMFHDELRAKSNKYEKPQMIEHTGRIKEINGSDITVTLIEHSACSACYAKGVCKAADMQEKTIHVIDDSGKFRQGERVMITGASSLGYKAMIWTFVVPVILIVTAVVLSIPVFHLSEIAAALIAVGILLLYALGLYLFKNKMKHTFQFHIKKLTKQL